MKSIRITKYRGLTSIFHENDNKKKVGDIYIRCKTKPSVSYWADDGEKMGLFRISTDGLERSFIGLTGIIKTRKNLIYVGDECELLI